MSKVGIVILNYNSTNYLKSALDSLYAAETKVPFAVGVLDNGSSREERDACQELVGRMQAEIRFFDAGRNLGFSGGNNVVIRHFLEQPDITHICLLNSDVLVTDYWLDYLLEKERDVIGPVTNAAGNEQTVRTDYDTGTGADDLAAVGSYAARRHDCYKGYVVESDLVVFFAAVLKREVIEKVGFLDERFYPGSYEDDDYCLRILEAGYHIAIARDCFIHHYGSGSFANLEMNKRQSISIENRERFEQKWNRPWKDRTWKVLKSCRQDLDFLMSEGQTWPRQQIDISLRELERLLADWGEAIRFFTAQTSDTQAGADNLSARQLAAMLWCKAKARARREWESAKNKIRRRTDKEKPEIKNPEIREQEQNGLQRIYQMIEAAGQQGHKPICVFAPMYNRENEKDGYVQRIKAIDTTALQEMCRIYLYDEGVDCKAMRFDFIDPLHGYIVFNSHDETQREEILKLAHTCKTVYTHSILRFMEDRTAKEFWRIFDDADIWHIWDVHGAVPEEYELSGVQLGGQLAASIERYMALRADVIVVVTEAMGRHLSQKYPSIQAEIVVVPIVSKALAEPVRCEKKDLREGISIVYAGGLQPWQNISLMQDIMAAAGSRYQYRMYVPEPEAFYRMWGTRRPAADITVESKKPEELSEVYPSCDFGFLLRDDSPVNYVACPTKLMEYLRYGIIPVLKSDQIGDFTELGMEYLPVRELLGGVRMTPEERRRMVENNYRVLDKLLEVHTSGLARLRSLAEQGSTWQRRSQGDKDPAIGLVVTTFDKGGLEQVVLNLYQGYRKAGYEVYLLCQENVLGLLAEQIEPGRLLVFENSLKRFLKMICRNNIKVLHYHYNVFGCREARERGIRTIYTMHNLYTWKSDSELQEYSSLLDGMDRVAAVSGLVRDYYLARTNARRDNLQVIGNGVDFGELSEHKLPRELERGALGLADADVVIAFVASFYPVKYQIGMIGVMEELKKEYPQARLLYIGNSENEYYQEFLKVYEKSPARDVMRIVPYFEHKYMGEFLRRVVDIFTLPTLQEGCSNAVLEAIYCEKPMVLTNVGNASDIAFLKSCLIVRTAYDDPVKTDNAEMLRISLQKNSANGKELTEAFAEMIDNLETYRQAARLSAEEKASWSTESMVQGYLALVEELAAGGEGQICRTEM